MNSATTTRTRLLLAASLLTCLIGCDQATKSIATTTLKDSPAKSYLHDTVRLDYALNSGGFLSLGRNLSPAVRRSIFVGFNSVLLMGVAGFLLFGRRLRLSAFVCLVLILAGGLGNLIDRVTNDGLVTDFINIGLGPVRTGIFNVADIAVTVGGCLAFYLSAQGETTGPDEPIGSDQHEPDAHT